MELILGNVFIRPNNIFETGHGRDGHTHNFDHVTFFDLGWWYVVAIGPNGERIERQFCSHEFKAAQMSKLVLINDELIYLDKNTPMPENRKEVTFQKTRRPILMNDNSFVFIEKNDSIPEDGKEIIFNNTSSHFALIRAEWEHQITLIGLTPGVTHGVFNCVYSHRTPQGDVTQIYDGWDKAYL